MENVYLSRYMSVAILELSTFNAWINRTCALQMI